MRAVCLISLSFLFACSNANMSESMLSKTEGGSDNSSYEWSNADNNRNQPTSESTEENTDLSQVERKLIKEGWIEFETKKVEETRERILAAVKNNGGYISSDESNNYSYRTGQTLVIRVPADKFDKLLAEATEGVKDFDNKNISVKDVTEEFLDAEARLKTKKELEQRYLDLLKKANSVSEILEIEREIGNLRSEIESIEGRLKYLRNQVSLSTLHISFYKSHPQGGTKFGGKFSEGLVNGWHGIIWFLIGLTNLWPLLLIGIIAVFLIRRAIRKGREKKVKK